MLNSDDSNSNRSSYDSQVFSSVDYNDAASLFNVCLEKFSVDKSKRTIQNFNCGSSNSRDMNIFLDRKCKILSNIVIEAGQVLLILIQLIAMILRKFSSIRQESIDLFY